MPYCLVPGCNYRPSPFVRVSYHGLPKDDVMARHWLEICGRFDLVHSKSAKSVKICTAHFLKCDYRDQMKYVLLTSGVAPVRPRLKDDAIPSLLLPGRKKTQTEPRAMPSNQHVSEALHDYESGRLDEDSVQAIRTQLKMRRKRDSRSPPRAAARAGTHSVPVLTSRGLSEQLAAEGGDGEPAAALLRPVVLQRAPTGREQQQSAAGAPVGGPSAVGAVLDHQRRICSLRLTLRRQTEQLHALQARHELELERLGVDGAAEAARALFPPLEAAVTAEAEGGAAVGELLLPPATLEEAAAELRQLREQTLRLRTALLESAAAANERALTANQQRADLLSVFTPRQAGVLLGQRARSDLWDAVDLRRATALRRVLTRHQYEYLRTQLRLPLPALRRSAAAAQTTDEGRLLYQRLLNTRREVDLEQLHSSAGLSGATTPQRQPGELLVLRGAAVGRRQAAAQWNRPGPQAAESSYSESTHDQEDFTDYVTKAEAKTEHDGVTEEVVTETDGVTEAELKTEHDRVTEADGVTEEVVTETDVVTKAEVWTDGDVVTEHEVVTEGEIVTDAGGAGDTYMVNGHEVWIEQEVMTEQQMLTDADVATETEVVTEEPFDALVNGEVVEEDDEVMDAEAVQLAELMMGQAGSGRAGTTGTPSARRSRGMKVAITPHGRLPPQLPWDYMEYQLTDADV